MKSISYTLLFCLFFLSLQLQAQKQIPTQQQLPPQVAAEQIKIESQHRNNIPLAPQNGLQRQSAQFRTLPKLKTQSAKQAGLIIQKAPDTGLPYVIYGQLPSTQLRSGASIDEQVNVYLNTVSKSLKIADASQEFTIAEQHADEQEQTHVRLKQQYEGIPIWGSEMILHSRNGSPYLLNGRYYPTPELENINASLSQNNALENAMSEVKKHTDYVEVPEIQQHLLSGNQQTAELVIYHIDEDPKQEVLVWHVTLLPNLMDRWEYFIDANTGEILHQYKSICQFFHGLTPGTEHEHCQHADHSEESLIDELPAKASRINGEETAFATDLKGISRSIGVYETGGTFYLIDASREMHRPSLSNFPNNPVGTIWSIDAFNTSPANSSFQYDHVTSGNNNWNNRTSVSAHFNGGLAYSYFRDNFTRNSINGNGGNIVSFINVADEDGSSMDNAFWNGAAIFYGNGRVAFSSPLAKAEDVAGHEMAHGVIQNTANLDYQNESGALNESYADIFGAMIDRDDWQIGEEIANPSVFPTGAMRDLQNPNNGGNSINDNGWQPKHMDEFVNLPNTPQGDNGGVHINSGIVNRAYYLFATDPAVGKARAEQVYYKALTDYLVRSARFIDMRIAAVQAATDNHGAGSAVVQAAERAFNTVGIGSGSSGGGGGGGTNTQQDIGVNPGQDFILWSDDQKSTINNALTNGTADGAFSNTDHISKPSVTDDGSIILFIDADGKMTEIDVDWSTGNVLNEFVLEETLKWRNVSTSRDGSKLAAVTGDLNNNEFDNRLFVFDFISGTSRFYDLYNPTFSTGVSTGDVLFADALEWDFAGENVMYDAANRLTSSNGTDITYWDIGFIKVWDNNTQDFTEGTVTKLFSGLGENQSVGNPTFSKNSDYIVAFDLIEQGVSGVENTLQGVNIQTGDIGTIFGLNTLGYPSYSKDDDEIIFSFLQNGTQPIIAVRSLENNKIDGTGDAFILIEDAEWAVWFATGDRDLTVNTRDLEQGLNTFSSYPNPFTKGIQVEIELEQSQKLELSVTDLMGRRLVNQSFDGQQGENTFNLPLAQLPAGTYFVLLQVNGEVLSRRVVKQ